MPFKSDAQRKYLFAKEPAVAREFASKEKKDKAKKPMKKVASKTRTKSTTRGRKPNRSY